jgi:hypothetical protein
MLSLQDCIALCELSKDEVLAIAHHERLPEIAAAELGNYLVLREFVLQHPACDERHSKRALT